MDIRERFFDKDQNLVDSLHGLQARMWTALPGVIQSVSFENGAPFASVQPAVKGRFVNDDLTIAWHDLPLLPHCPIHFARGGGFSLTFPVNEGDECLLVFASRSLDEWFRNGEAQPAYDLRQHDLSDGIALVGLTSAARPLANISQASAQLRSDDGQTVIDVKSGSITMTVGGCRMQLTSSGLAVTGGKITSDTDVQAGPISLTSHIHPGVQTGSGTTQKPE
ncbi:phage-related protein [Neoasaia chiangmaiensis NBRC 101099]|uniref:Uncharacterized protein n=1 Tax=Neoasaia chiangmaiensis TaxID=320497 RepID=A0A1U9KQV7_9PROT|nr:Gp138 family membrane-puncturing spike protein [Neoasaia chiangmaiensis]AQS88176.1 hypothetical protein A0U93_09750 [Neoasaia chiangmaiensis]GBR39929.1 phage-related protein [Neoasaia chiangmaiensis NBRC 101099]GEN14805.1 hypothetical protein NCH01_12360 [Neoasaia chiangmaiensis]